ncbi:MAG: UbiD family decarboxylase, partial [Desulfobacterales bacterium]|nr:UbiD family decarboxylase [Desulfobacterales bacterium]
MRTLSGLKEFIYYLEGLGELRKISAPVERHYEIPAILNQLGGKDAPALLFERVKGYTMPVVGNLLGTQRRLALALDISEDDFAQGTGLNLEKKISPFLLKEENERVVLSLNEESDIQEFLPILTHYEKDSGPFITTAITSARNPVTGVMGRGLHRIEIRGKTHLGISLVNPPLSNIYAAHKAQGTRMNVAVAVGVDPAVLIGTILKSQEGTDKLATAGGMVGSAIATVNAQTTDLDLPAYAEIVLEGYIDPKEDEQDSVLGEVSGNYVGFSSPTIQVTTVTMRRNAVYHGLLPQGAEVDQLLAFSFGLNVIPKIKRDFPSIIDIHFTPGTFGSHVVMSTSTDDRGDIRRAVTAMLSFSNIKK